MKPYLLVLLVLLGFGSQAQKHKTENIVFISVDGYRWKEVFQGMDTLVFNQKRYRKQDSTATMKQYWATTPQERRQKLMPFFWNTIVKQGQLYGNRDLGNLVNVKNPYWFSYPGRSETITGFADPKVNSNEYPDNPNTNVFEFVNQQKGYQGKVATFASWGAVARIVNRNRNKMPFINPYEKVEGNNLTEAQQLANEIQDFLPKYYGEEERWDGHTYAIAKSYMLAQHPKMVYIDFGDPDELAHSGQYDYYLESGHYIDQMIASLWKSLQADPFYKDKTTLVICPDHGRGDNRQWTSHGSSYAGANNTWLALLGPDTPASGEMNTKTQIYQDQFAQTMANLLGFEFKADHPIGLPVKSVMK
jgi:hypothetical protein